MIKIITKQLFCFHLLFVLNVYCQEQEKHVNKGVPLAESFYYLFENEKIDNSDSVVFITSRDGNFAKGYVKGILFKRGKYKTFKFFNGRYKFSWFNRKIPENIPDFKLLCNLSYEEVNYDGVKKDEIIRGNGIESRFIAFYEPGTYYFKSIHYQLPIKYRNNLSVEKKLFFEGFDWVDEKIHGFKLNKPLTLKNNRYVSHPLVKKTELQINIKSDTTKVGTDQDVLE